MPELTHPVSAGTSKIYFNKIVYFFPYFIHSLLVSLCNLSERKLFLIFFSKKLSIFLFLAVYYIEGDEMIEKILKLMELKGFIVSEEDRMVKKYGLELFLNACANAAILMITGCLLGYPLQTVLFYLTYLFFKKDTGGYHADSHAGCILQFNLACLCLFLSYRYGRWRLRKKCILLFLSLMVFLFAPVTSRNKKISQKQQERHHRNAVLKMFFMCLLLYTLEYIPFWNDSRTDFIYLGLLMVGVTLLLGIIKNIYLERKEKVK